MISLRQIPARDHRAAAFRVRTGGRLQAEFGGVLAIFKLRVEFFALFVGLENFRHRLAGKPPLQNNRRNRQVLHRRTR